LKKAVVFLVIKLTLSALTKNILLKISTSIGARILIGQLTIKVATNEYLMMLV
jgi:hypothetical protein